MTQDVERLTAPGMALIDVNVVPRDGACPTATMSGAEFDLAIMSGGRLNGRLAVFSVATIARRDLTHLASAMAGSVTITDSGVDAPYSVTVFAPRGALQGRLRADGKAWPATLGRAIVPAGKHRLEWTDGAPIGPAILRFTGETTDAAVSGGSLTLAYDAAARALLVIDLRPVQVEIDGTAGPAPFVPNPDGGFTVTLPAGPHSVRITVAGQ